MLWVILLGLLIAQVPIMPGESVTIQLNGDALPVDLAYRSDGGEYLTVITHNLSSDPIDVTLEILSDERRLAFNDDHQTDRVGLEPQDAVIETMIVAEPAEVTIRVNSFNGAQSGPVEIRIETASLIAPCQIPIQTGRLYRNRAFRCSLDLEIEQVVSITARDTSGTLDPILILSGVDGNLLAINDDHVLYDLSLNTLDSRIDGFNAPDNGTFIITVRDLSGAAGTFELTVSIAS